MLFSLLKANVSLPAKLLHWNSNKSSDTSNPTPSLTSFPSLPTTFVHSYSCLLVSKGLINTIERIRVAVTHSFEPKHSFNFVLSRSMLVESCEICTILHCNTYVNEFGRLKNKNKNSSFVPQAARLGNEVSYI